MTDIIEGSSDRLPPNVSTNVHGKISAAQVSVRVLVIDEKHNVVSQPQLVDASPLPEPKPKYPLILSWSPSQLNFYLYEEPVECKLWIWNSTPRSIYMQCCGLWDDTSRLGASWLTGPRTRFLLSPGLKAQLFVRAKPQPEAPIPSAHSSLQIAASHLRDQVTGYFMIPVNTCFLKYEPPPNVGLGE